MTIRIYVESPFNDQIVYLLIFFSPGLNIREIFLMKYMRFPK